MESSGPIVIPLLETAIVNTIIVVKTAVANELAGLLAKKMLTVNVRATIPTGIDLKIFFFRFYRHGALATFVLFAGNPVYGNVVFCDLAFAHFDSVSLLNSASTAAGKEE